VNAGQISPRSFGCSTVSSCFKSAWNSQPFGRTTEIASCFTVSRFCGEPQRNLNRKIYGVTTRYLGPGLNPVPSTRTGVRTKLSEGSSPETDEAVRQRRVFSSESIG
jgi:hypothetical protein